MENRSALVAVAAPLLFLKVWSIVLLLLWQPTAATVIATVATTWGWVVVALLLAAGPLLAWWRLVRVRARRDRLRRSEWMLDERSG